MNAILIKKTPDVRVWIVPKPRIEPYRNYAVSEPFSREFDFSNAYIMRHHRYRR